jgi:tetratricopeptide (TPR) repeat protein
MRRRWSLLLLAVLLPHGASAVTDGERAGVYREFRGLFDARKYQEAKPLAEKVVAMTEEQYGTADRALVNPLCNLATTAYRMQDYATAERNYVRSVEILEASGAGADRQILRPLHGLGATFIAAKQFENAIVPLKQAVDLSRNLDGLFNVGQLEYLEPLIVGYVALERRAEAEKEHQYSLRIAESAYGKDGTAMLGPLDRYAHWLEDTGRYTTSRALYARALIIAEKHQGKGALATVEPLHGIARTYRLEFLNGREEPTEGDDTNFGMGGMSADSSGQPHLNPDGERALKQALITIHRHPPIDHRKVGETLTELGDWYLSGGSVPKSMEVYREAWKELALAQATRPLESPQLIAYRGPSSSVKRSSLNPEDANLHYVDVTFTVTKEGRTSGIAVVASDAPESLQKSVESMVKKARYRPRFEAGQPVETSGVALREQLLLRKPKNQEPA